MQTYRKTIQDRKPNFRGESGKLFLVRCFSCESKTGRENWAPAVASGTCAWCGWGEKGKNGVKHKKSIKKI